jgi:hypothetical protein
LSHYLLVGLKAFVDEAFSVMQYLPAAHRGAMCAFILITFRRDCRVVYHLSSAGFFAVHHLRSYHSFRWQAGKLRRPA